MTRPSIKRLLAGALLFGVFMASISALADDHDNCQELVLYNGKIATMDRNDAFVSSVTIKYGRIAAIGSRHGIPKHLPCAETINLRGRTVIPGLIDSHDHFVVLSRRPGHDVRLEIAASVADVQEMLRFKSKSLNNGEWISSIGGWDAIAQLAEKRLPDLSELDGAVPNNPVLLSIGLVGPSSTNTLGKKFFESKGIVVGSDGSISGGNFGGANASLEAIDALRSIQTEKDLRQAALDAMKYSLSVGLTTHNDQGGGFPPVNFGPPPEFGTTPPWKGLVETSNNSSSLDPFTGYNTLVQLDREGQMSVRLRLFFYIKDLGPHLIFLRQRLNNTFPNFGDSYLKTTGVGEWIAAGTLTDPLPIYEAAARLVAQKGWSYDQHSQALEDERAITSVWEKVNATTPISGLRWSLAHVPGIDTATINRLKAIGAAVAPAGAYLGDVRRKPAPLRTLIDSGIKMGYGSDGGSATPLDPWLHIYYMTTGKNNVGAEVNSGQTITRMEALRLYTIDNAWFSRDEGELGSIEKGKLADLVVLSDDFLDRVRVPDESIKHITSVLTIVGGEIVYDTGILVKH